MEKKWFGVRTFNGYEQKVIDSLKTQIEKEKMEAFIDDIYLPTIQEYTIVRHQLKKKERLLYPGYIFVHMENNNETIFFVRGIQYVTGYAGIASMKEKPSPMDDEEIERMKQETQNILVDLKPGDLVTINSDDIYQGQQLHVVSVNPEEELVTVEVNSILGDDSNTETYPFDMIKK